MIRWSLIFFVVAVLAAILGQSGFGDDSAHIGIYLAVVGTILAIGMLLLHRRSGIAALRLHHWRSVPSATAVRARRETPPPVVQAKGPP